MSGICGVIALDGRRPGRAEIDALLKLLERRGPDGSNAWFGDSAVLGQASLATTPEAVVEKLPLRSKESGCTITADARLDNREELAAKVGLERKLSGVGDGELILLAFQKWGDQCVDHLLGDFAFAIWDQRRRRLFAARDQIGMRQLCYAYRPGKHFVFATDPWVVAEHPEVDRQINLRRVAQFLDELEAADLRATFFDGVHRLEAAHCLVLDERGLDIRRYWTVEIPPRMRLRLNEEYAEALHEELSRAIAPRLRSTGKVGAMLSGGMDSSSVCAVAARLLGEAGCGPLETFSIIGPDPESCVETRAILAALGIPNIRPSLVRFDDPGVLADRLVEAGLQVDEPFDALMTLPRAAYAAARHAGINVVLDGVGGDITLSLPSHVARLLRRGRFLAALSEARGERAYWGPSWPAWRPFARGLVQAFAPPLWRARQAIRDWSNDRSARSMGRLSPQFAANTDLVDTRRRARRLQRRLSNVDRGELARQIAAPNLLVGRERYDRAAARFGVEPRDPFLDLRFIRFCLSLPTNQLQSNGFPKPILRRAMAGLVPDEVRWRPGKEHLGQSMTEDIMAGAWPDDDLSALEPFVDAAVMSKARDSLSVVHHQNLRTELLTLDHWLKRNL